MDSWHNGLSRAGFAKQILQDRFGRTACGWTVGITAGEIVPPVKL